MAPVEAKGLLSEHPLPTLYIGSVICPSGEKKLVLEAAMKLAALNPSSIHQPQTPQLGEDKEINPYLMNPEAVKNLPLLVERDGKLVYDLVVSREGNVLPKNEKRAQEFGELETEVANLILQVQSEDENPRGVNHSLNQLIEMYPNFNWMPDGVKELIKYLKDPSHSIPEVIKLEISGPINSSFGIWTYNENNQLEKGAISSNQQLLMFHSGLTLARSLLWTRAIQEALGENGKKPEIIFSFDEPDFEILDKEGGPRSETVYNIYQNLWGESKNLPYKRMVHVCGSFVPKMLKYVDYINFDVWNKGNLVVGNEQNIKEFFERGGKIVAGIVPTDKADIAKFLPAATLGQTEDLNVLLYQPDFATALLKECVSRTGKLIDRLLPTIPLDTLLNHLVISPQCGLGGLVKYPREQAADYSRMVYHLTELIAVELGKLRNFTH